MKRNFFSIRRIILIFLLCLVSISIMAQKVNLDTLDINQLNLYKEKAINMKNTGIGLTIAGGAVFAIGNTLFVNFIIRDIRDKNPNTNQTPGIIYFSGALCGLASTAVGVPLLIIGNNKTTGAEIALKKFDFKTNNSMAFGLGLAIRF